MLLARLALASAAFAAALFAESKPKDIRGLAREGSAAIPRIAEYLRSDDVEMRREAVKTICAIGTQHSLDPLVQAARDNDPEIQIRAADCLVNFYLPGYVRTGLSATLRRVGDSVKGKFSDTNDQVIDAYVQPRQDVVEALGRLARGGASMESRANAARAVGVLRGRAAVADLTEALRSKDSAVLYETIVAFQKINDPATAPSFRFLIRDLDEKVQLAAIETTGLMRNKDALPDLKEVLLNRSRPIKVRRALLTAIAMIGQPESRPLFEQYIKDGDERLRAAAAEGFARLKNPSDVPMLESAFEEEKRPSARLSLAFALVACGKTELSEFSPLQLLINTLNSKARQGEAFAFLVELARDERIRRLLYPSFDTGTRDEKIQLARILARSGGQDSVAALEKLAKDEDAEVAGEGTRALRNLKARLGSA
jgi:HEAT repeat protein